MEQGPETVATSPIVEQRASVLFMLFLLVVSAMTASVVGYRVKSADLDRKNQLLETYAHLGGSFQKAYMLGTTLYQKDLPAEQATFILVYETNVRARQFGLYRVLETTPASVMEACIKGLYAVNATESAHTTEDAWRAFSENRTNTLDQSNAQAARFARQYDRYLARDTEVKLFAYLRDHKGSIRP